MYCALYLRHMVYPKDGMCAGDAVKLVAIAKTFDELKGWMYSHVVDVYHEEGPDLTTGMTKVYKKEFARGSILEWYEYPETLELNDTKATGFVDMQTYEEVEAQISESVGKETQRINSAAQHQLDHYRNNVEPKMVSYDPAAPSTLRRPN